MGLNARLCGQNCNLVLVERINGPVRIGKMHADGLIMFAIGQGYAIVEQIRNAHGHIVSKKQLQLKREKLPRP